MADAPLTATHFLDALTQARCNSQPFRHWALRDILPASMVGEILGLPISPPAVDDTQGRRETHNSTRQFFTPAKRALYPVCENLASALQSRLVVSALERNCDIKMTGTSLRIEYCQDMDGFWLEPHTDIGAKIFTMLIYLVASPNDEQWGTDLYAGPRTYAITTAFAPNLGIIFIPGQDSWHGFSRRKITGIRRSLIVNYVTPDWRARHELAFPETTILW